MRRQALTLVRSALRTGPVEVSCLNTTTTTTAAAASVAFRRGFADDANLLKTPLYDFHIEHGGKPCDAWFSFSEVAHYQILCA